MCKKDPLSVEAEACTMYSTKSLKLLPNKLRVSSERHPPLIYIEKSANESIHTRENNFCAITFSAELLTMITILNNHPVQNTTDLCQNSQTSATESKCWHCIIYHVLYWMIVENRIQQQLSTSLLNSTHFSPNSSTFLLVGTIKGKR